MDCSHFENGPVSSSPRPLDIKTEDAFTQGKSHSEVNTSENINYLQLCYCFTLKIQQFPTGICEHFTPD